MQDLEQLSHSTSIDPELAKIWARFYTYGAHRHADASMEKHSAFASSILSLTRAIAWSPPGFPQGPSMRALAVDYSVAGPNGTYKTIETAHGNLLVIEPDGTLPPAGEWLLHRSMYWSEHYCYCPIEKELKLFDLVWLNTYHFDNDADDIAFMTKRTGRPQSSAPELNHNIIGHGLRYNSDDQVWTRQALPFEES